MKKNDSIRNLMTANPQTVHTRQKVSEVRELFANNAFHHLPVVSGDQLVGLLSASDILRVVPGGWGADDRSVDAMLDHQFTIEQLMVRDVTTVADTGTVRDAVMILARGQFHAVPVVDGSNALVGIVTSTDVIRYLAEQY